MSTLSSRDNLVQRYPTAIVKTTPEYKANVTEWQQLIDQLKERLQEATNEGKPKSLALHKKRGQLSGKEDNDDDVDRDTHTDWSISF